MDQRELDIIKRLNTSDEGVIKVLFDEYYEYLCRSIYRVVPDASISEDIVQEVFMELWKKRETININTSIKAYLRRSALNRALNYLRKNKVRFEEEVDIPDLGSHDTGGQANLEATELEQRIHRIIDALPERCRIIFGMSRFEEMSYKEIAEALDISVKTVENQMSKALKILRVKLEPYLA
jgi:RNA polymerase sigma-70 factor (ECF subfamily)